MKQTIRVSSAAETEAFGCELAKRLDSAGIKRAFIALFGEMGVGKTAFVRGFASFFGIGNVKSPTYTVVNEYHGDGGERIFHFDLYRIDGADDLESIGFDDYVRADGYCISEWSSRVPEEIPEDAVTVNISRDPDCETGRIIEITGIPA